MAFEADFPFAEFEQEFNKNLIDEFNGLTEQSQQTRKVRLSPRGNMDPFYQAQILASDLDLVDPQPVEGHEESPLLVNVPVSEVLGRNAVEQLNNQYASDVIKRRLTLSASNLQFFRPNGQPDWWNDDAVISGIFDRFDFTDGLGQPTLFALFDDPRFIAPNFIQDDYVKKIHVPVLVIDEWHMDSKF